MDRDSARLGFTAEIPLPNQGFSARFLGRIAATGASLDEETKHRLTMAHLRMMPVEMLDRAYNRYRLEHHGINLDDHRQYRTYQTFYEMGIAPPSHQEMADIIERTGVRSEH